MALRKVEKNWIYLAIEEAGLDPAEFELVTDMPFEYGSVVLQHPRSKSECALAVETAFGFPGRCHVGDGPTTNQCFNSILEAAQLWLIELKEDLEAPDLWAELERSQAAYSQVVFEDPANTPFSVDEQAVIATRIEEIKHRLQSHDDLSAEQLGAITARLDYLVSAAERLGRKDWHVLAMGALFSIAAAALVPPDVVHGILQSLLSSLSHLLRGTLRQLPS